MGRPFLGPSGGGSSMKAKFIEWDPSYNVGIESIDEDHMRLVETMNLLHEGIMEGKRVAAMQKTLQMLLNYTREHFGKEEDLLRRAKYPRLNEHIEEHSRFVAKVTEYLETFLQGKTAFSLQLLNFMKNWLLSHILTEDRNYIPYMKKANLTTYDID